MKNTILGSLVLIGILIMAYKFPVQTNGDYNECFVKINSAFGEPCGTCEPIENTYKVVLKNTCNEPIDVQVCVQGKYNRYRCFLEEKVGVNDTVVAYDCNGTGSYLRWSRQAGDETKTFPTKEEVNQEYAK